jgi:hypothetical protein
VPGSDIPLRERQGTIGASGCSPFSEDGTKAEASLSSTAGFTFMAASFSGVLVFPTVSWFMSENPGGSQTNGLTGCGLYANDRVS